ncbi:hypothetical protein HY386_01505 [Candidatus Daviesbacteria bacterium]|nr:hypothetical protein [Candidatus Daviesbacteria bacterium]
MPSAKTIFSALGVGLFLLLTPAPALAQSLNPVATPAGALTTDTLTVNLAHTLSCLTEGKAIDRKPCFENLDNPLGATTNIPSVGAIGISQYLTMELFANPPISTVHYLANIQQTLGIINPAFAQVSGTGGQVVAPVLNLWVLLRNLAYVVMIILFVVIGFMIMLRKHINPQTVISVQNALPGLVVGLILITFSYFFAALIIDGSFVVTNVVGKILEASDPSGRSSILPPGTTTRVLENENVLTIFNSFLGYQGAEPSISAVSKTLNFINQGLVQQIVDGVLVAVGCGWGYTVGRAVVPDNVIILGHSLGTLTSIIAGGIGCAASAITLVASKGIILGLILYVVLIIALLIAMFKLLFSLIGAYISVIVLTITAPLYFLIGSFPGKGNLVGEWIKSMVANVLIFPAVFLVFLFAAYMGSTPGNDMADVFRGVNGAGTFNANFTLPLFGGFPVDLVRLLLAYGILLALPAVPDAVRKMFNVQGLGAFAETAMGTFSGGAAGGADLAKGGKGLTQWAYNQPGFNARINTARGFTRDLFGRIRGIRPLGWLPKPKP